LPASPRVFAIDWSGALKGSRKKIWLAEVSGGRLVRLESGRDRSGVICQIIAESKKTPEMIVGLDFAFSAPEWFVKFKNCSTIHEFWGLAREHGETWMKEWPFWSKYRPERKPDSEFRRCEEVLLQTAAKPSSIFKLVGPSQVGRGSVRGMPCLLQLHQNGFSIWPFDLPGWPRTIEIYPRLFTPGIVKSDPEARRSFVQRYRERCSSELFDQVAKNVSDSDDAFDALASAFAMSERIPELCSLTQSTDPQTNLEGAIWPQEV
jgi:hypothetical protein